MKIIVIISGVLVGLFSGVVQASIGNVIYSPDSGAMVLVGSLVVGGAAWARRRLKK